MAWGSGRVPVGINTSDSNFNTSEKIGGNSNHSHTLNNAYGHLYIGSTYIYYNRKENLSYITNIRKDCGGSYYSSSSDRAQSDLMIGGSTDNGNTLQPYIVCYMWKRTA